MKAVNQRKIGVMLTYMLLAFNVIMGLVYTPFMISKIGDSQYGIYSIANSLISFVSILDLGFGQTLVRYVSRARAMGNKKEEYKFYGMFLKLYSVIAIIALLVGLAIVMLYPKLVVNRFAAEEIKLFRVVFTILLLNVAISFPMSIFSAVLNSYEKFYVLKLSNFLVTVLKYLVLFLVLWFGGELVGVTIVTAISAFVLQCVYLIYTVKELGIHFDFSKVEVSFRNEIILFSFYIFLNLLIDFLYSNTDKLILGAVAGTVSVSIYSIGIYFSMYFTELSTAMSGVFMPRIVEMYQKNNLKEISDTFNKVGRLQMALLFLVLGGYVCLGREFIRLWVGASYHDSYYIGLIIMIPSIVPLTQNIGISVIRAMNIHKYRSYMYIVIAIVNVGLSIPLAIKYGGIGSAIGTSIATIGGQIIFMNWFYSRKAQINLRDYWKSFVQFLTVTASVVLVGLVIKSFLSVNSWMSFLIQVGVFVVMYLFAFWKFTANEYEKNLVLTGIKRITYTAK